MDKITEQSSHYDELENKSTRELLQYINQEDRKVAYSVYKAIPTIESLVESIVPKVKEGGRLFYLGSGTSGRLGILDASECPPTFGVAHGMVVGLIAGGDSAIRKSVEMAEDNTEQAWKDLKEYGIRTLDSVVGIAASGTTPYVVHGLKACQEKGILTACITCNHKTPIIRYSDHPIKVIVGPEFVTGSSRMKAGTAQKMVLNMITTSLMIRLGRIKGNNMVDMQLSNDKLWDRGTKMIMEKTSLSYDNARKLLDKHGSVRAALDGRNE